MTLNGQDLDYTVADRATGTSQIVGMALVTTTVVNSVLTVRNPAGNAAALTITPLAGGTRPVSAHLVITQIARYEQQRANAFRLNPALRGSVRIPLSAAFNIKKKHPQSGCFFLMALGIRS